MILFVDHQAQRTSVVEHDGAVTAPVYMLPARHARVNERQTVELRQMPGTYDPKLAKPTAELVYCVEEGVRRAPEICVSGSRREWNTLDVPCQSSPGRKHYVPGRPLCSDPGGGLYTPIYPVRLHLYPGFAISGE